MRSAAFILLLVVSGCECAGPVPPQPPTQDIETLCDGFDNDGEGRQDVSRAFALADAGAGLLGAAPQTNGVAFVVSRNDHAEVWRLDSDLNVRQRWTLAFTSPMTGFARLFPLNDALIVGINESDEDAGRGQVRATLLLSDGGTREVIAADGGTVLASFPRTLSAGFDVVSSLDGQCHLLLWRNQCEGWLREGMTISPGGVEIARRGLSRMPFAECHLDGPSQFYPGVGEPFARIAGGGAAEQWNITLEHFGCDLSDAGSVSYELRGRVPNGATLPFLLANDLRVFPEAPVDDFFVYEAAFPPRSGPAPVWSLGRGPDPYPILPSPSPRGYVGPVARGTRGPFISIQDHQEDGGLALRAQNLLSGATVEIDDGLFYLDIAYPALPVGPDLFVVLSRREGVVYARFFCAP